MTPEELELYMYYVGWFMLLTILALITRTITKKHSHDNTTNTDIKSIATTEYIAFRRHYLLVYLFMVGADWLQGPYVYALYKYYGYDISDIGLLFIIGFGSSMVFGTIVGSAADKYGRKYMCILFGIMYSIACCTKHSHQFSILCIGRLLGGISTSILYSSFESWLVYTHNEFKLEPTHGKLLLDTTFSTAGMGNSLVAILSGVVASTARDKFGPVAPFDVSMICLIIGSILIVLYWKTDQPNHSYTNHQSNNINLYEQMKLGLNGMLQDNRIWLLGLVQSFFEGSMYVFVFMWTPALESTSTQPIYHGWIFGTFMISAFIGSTLFEYVAVVRQIKHELIMLSLLVVSGMSLIIPAFVSQHTVRLLSFMIFEVCVGCFWPACMSLREKYITNDNVRTTTMNLFRIPLNAIVVIVLLNIGQLSELQVFATCVLCLAVSLVCCYQIYISPMHMYKQVVMNDGVIELAAADTPSSV